MDSTQQQALMELNTGSVKEITKVRCAAVATSPLYQRLTRCTRWGGGNVAHEPHNSCLRFFSHANRLPTVLLFQLHILRMAS
ncbi:hypothetical protein GH5_04809 [Leishmania sp. Ghana 2012 LV757]|uniref:hypothetical protein n=1 Tax=Leishmania sp. Ghana 2012 LV757 TaxID=2803181 RepID=UPI001B6D07F8|nr:hypothetical protein GH5_04809 [Leishmania sp. Ghana 2012 LV757]